ncbi:hypothetical protein HDV63DRAFT_372352 [Trichoderma sp. SZMC 28014]
MATVRKSCRNCTSSKRKCTVQVPQCDRCSKKGLQCVYDLEPLSASAVDMKKDSKTVSSTFSSIESGYCVIKTLTSLSSSNAVIYNHEETFVLDMMRIVVQSVHDLLWKCKPALFIHPWLQIQGNYNHYAVLTENQTGGVNHPSFKRLLKLDIKTVPILEALTAVQAFLVHMTTSLFSPDPMEQANAEKYNGILSVWTQVLLTEAQPRQPQALSPWQRWLFGESVRRTILMSHAVALLFFSLKHGLCSNCLFFESLPIDRRLGLWLSESPQAWIAAAGVKLGKDVGEQLSSLHEFAQDLDMASPNFSGDIFLTLIVIGHNGRYMNQTNGS